MYNLNYPRYAVASRSRWLIAEVPVEGAGARSAASHVHQVEKWSYSPVVLWVTRHCLYVRRLWSKPLMRVPLIQLAAQEDRGSQVGIVP